jgi:hypothetical protein
MNEGFLPDSSLEEDEFSANQNDTSLKLALDRFDFDFGELLAVAVFLTVAFTAFLFENDHFITFQVADYTSANISTFDVGHANGYFTVVINKMNGIETHCVAFVGCQPVDEDLLTFLNFELLTGDGNNCEHCSKSKI